MKSKIILGLVLVCAILVIFISGCIKADEGITDVGNDEEAGEVAGDMSDEVDKLASDTSQIDEDLSGG